MSASPIGLLVVHGIGNQRPGELCREIALALGQKDANRETEAERGLLRRAAVAGRDVIVAEASWSALSSPDNPPEVRSPAPVFRDLLETIPAAWRESHLGRMVRELDRYCHFGSISAAALALSYLGALFGLMLGWGVPDAFDAVTGAFLLVFVFYFVLRNVRTRVGVLVDASRLRRLVEGTTWGLASYFAAFFVVVSPLLGGVVLLYFAVVVVCSGVFVVVAAVLARLFALLGIACYRVRLPCVQTWIHRFAAAIIVLPSHVVLQAVRSMGNLFSVVMVERAWQPRVVAAGAFVLVYIASLLLILLWEVVLLVSLMVPWVFKRMLPGIDLLLDVANYQLANASGRREYHERVERAVNALVGAGCKEVHVLAHSLGTVLFYDWLKSTEPGRYPIATLHTIGSPLNKFWYVDHGVQRRRDDRSGLDAYVRDGWTNFWALSDPVSGTLTRCSGPGLPVSNERLRNLGPFLASHVRYWKNPGVLESVRKGIAAAAQPVAVAK